MRKRRAIIVTSFLGMILTIICIGYFSHQGSEVSYEITNSVVSGVTKKPETQSEWNQYSSYLPIARKMAHVLLYSSLGFFCSVYLSSLAYFKGYPKRRVLTFTLLVCFIYGILDELHQSFIPGRGATFFDVLLDTIGGVIGVLVSFALARLLRFSRLKIDETGE